VWDLQGTYVFWSESYSWSYQWLQLLSRHHLAKLSNLSLPVPGAHFLNIGVPRNRRYNYCVLIGIVMLFQLGEALVLISSFSLLQKMIELPTISHFMEGFLQLHTLGCCVPIILMVVTILVPILEVGGVLTGLGRLSIGVPLISIRILRGLVWKRPPLYSFLFGRLSG